MVRAGKHDAALNRLMQMRDEGATWSDYRQYLEGVITGLRHQVDPARDFSPRKSPLPPAESSARASRVASASAASASAASASAAVAELPASARDLASHGSASASVSDSEPPDSEQRGSEQAPGSSAQAGSEASEALLSLRRARFGDELPENPWAVADKAGGHTHRPGEVLRQPPSVRPVPCHPPSPCTNWTRLVLPPVLSGHVRRAVPCPAPRRCPLAAARAADRAPRPSTLQWTARTHPRSRPRTPPPPPPPSY